MTDYDQPTCWQLIQGAAAGRDEPREEFARRYLPTVRAYLRARWRGGPFADEVDDVAQEVFVALLRDGGALEKADPEHGGGFRALLHAVTRNVALHAERTRVRRHKRVGSSEVEVDAEAADDPTLSVVFDRAYAKAMVRQAREQMDRAAQGGDEAQRRRVELLRLLFEDGVPIRDIAVRWGEDPARLHREYAKARREFREAIAVAVAGNECWSGERVEQECRRLLQLLS